MANFIPPGNGASLGSFLCTLMVFALKNSVNSTHLIIKIVILILRKKLRK